MPKPRLKTGVRCRGHGQDPLRDFTHSIVLQEYRDPVVRLERCPQKTTRRSAIYGNHGTQLPVLVRDTRPVNVELDNVAQSTPEKSASMVRDSALPTLSNVPTQPRGD
jgi:hypothetical protein